MKGTVLLTGGLALDVGLLAGAAGRTGQRKDHRAGAVNHPDSIYAGAIGAALWGAFRHDRLQELQAIAVDEAA